MSTGSSAATDADRWPGTYRRRTPEATVLHELVRDHLPALLAAARERSEHGYGYPQFIEQTFAQYRMVALVVAEREPMTR